MLFRSQDGSIAIVIGANHLTVLAINPDFKVLFEYDYTIKSNYWYRDAAILKGDESLVVSLANHLSRQGPRVVQRFDLNGTLLTEYEIGEENFLSDRGPNLLIPLNSGNSYIVETETSATVYNLSSEVMK